MLKGDLSVAAVRYSGAESLTFPGYIDLATGRTLAVDPGGTYDVAPVNAGPEVPADGRFTEITGDESLPAEEEFVPGKPEEETPAEGEER
jgi:hypothetical protein